ncbi:hypothetical protein KP509_04G067000 [Ceratopteris richardii]|uniref:Mediator of RNA polymerase II transcription subunit 28 n=1 Tax=Ceratopteris richardii TaxID=49495 RepID=A0A8T2UWC6_CERRI|nr:hypothetical protein KP509_04G067000 [Ceratopteris richardii]
MNQAEVMRWVTSLEMSLLPCLPARELQAMDRSAHPSHQADVERHVKEFMEAAWKLQLFFISLHHKHRPSKEEAITQEIEALESELKEKNELLEKQRKLLIGWRELLITQKATQVNELEKI